MKKKSKELKQKYIKSTINPEEYMLNKFNESIADKITDDCSLLILPKNKNNLNIINIRSQILITVSEELLKNRVLIQAIANY